MHSNMYERSMPSPSSRIRRFIAWFICLFGGLLGLIGATIMFFVSAAVVPSAVILLVIALLVCFGVTYAGCRIGLRLARRSHTTQQRFSLRISVGLSAVFGALVTFFIFRPLMLSAAAPTADATQYWTLSSGSRIAYTYYPALGSREPTPILFLHGGPGLFVLPTDHSFYRQFTRDGFDVYLYDQAGSGRSAPLASIEEYTVRRSVADVEAIRQQIGAEQLILIGHSWGSTLAASYMAAYPTHVAKVIFHSPGALWVREVQREFHRTAWTGAEEAPPLRILVALNLLGINPAAAESLISQDELGRWFDKQAATMSTQMVCAGDSQQLPPDMSGSGGNFYANLAIRGSIDGASDAPRPRLASNTTPALIVHGACDYIPWDVAYEYKQTLPQASLVPIDRAGHMINLTHSELLYTVMRSFLLNEPLPIPAYTQPEPPVGH